MSPNFDIHHNEVYETSVEQPIQAYPNPSAVNIKILQQVDLIEVLDNAGVVMKSVQYPLSKYTSMCYSNSGHVYRS